MVLTTDYFSDNILSDSVRIPGKPEPLTVKLYKVPFKSFQVHSQSKSNAKRFVWKASTSTSALVNCISPRGQTKAFAVEHSIN